MTQMTQMEKRSASPAEPRAWWTRLRRQERHTYPNGAPAGAVHPTYAAVSQPVAGRS